ncbi:hypothetical protein [Streptacidiphilus rugosus]|uniref:hypothetical protein n=1 Tax=Streptacidiphilus rugosus TaxID=405783 RepID=UPI00068E10EC|nr:hypothetical protein [Streptacidiphilus rugosus]
MIILRIHHRITDLDTWLAAFARFESARAQAGVRCQHIRQPVDDPAFIDVDLGFDTVAAAQSCRGFLVRNVWPSPANAPALSGRPRATILKDVAAPSTARAATSERGPR